MAELGRRPLLTAFACGFVMLLWVYRETFLSLVETWRTNDTFSYGYLIAPISLWLAWERRGRLQASPIRLSLLGALALLAAGCLWFVASGVGVRVASQFAAVAMIPALVVTTYGAALSRVIAFPLAYLAFAVPIGDSAVPMLMEFTADVASWALRNSGVPIFRTDLTIDIPSGSFLVARECSGLNYVVAGLALGALYSYVMYDGWKKRLVAMAFFAFMPIVANGLRVYLTILAAHLTEMRFGPGEEHVWFGRVLFIVLMACIGALGMRWRDCAVPSAPIAAGVQSLRPRPHGATIAMVLVLIALSFSVPAYLDSVIREAQRRLSAETATPNLPAAASGWTGPDSAVVPWRPAFDEGLSSLAGTYVLEGDGSIDLFVATYPVASRGGSEMISYQNTISREDLSKVLPERMVVVSLSSGERLGFTERVTGDSQGQRVVWYGYVIGGRLITDPFRAKLYEGLEFVRGSSLTESIVTVSTRADGSERSRLEKFVRDHARCMLAEDSLARCT
jgi:exosortase A